MSPEDLALNLLGGLIVGYCVAAAAHFWIHKRTVSWDYEQQRWRSSALVFQDRGHR
jgi:hypothetical protein